MNFDMPHQETEQQPEARERFWQQELAAMFERNTGYAAGHEAMADMLAERKLKRQAIVVTCMDERAFNVEEAEGLIPGEAEVYASGGGKIDAATFETLYGKTLAEAEAAGKEIEIYLTPHECSGGDELGCAAFANDKAAQKDFFTKLKAELKAKYPKANIHALAIDTSTDHLRTIDADMQDAALAPMLAENAERKDTYEDAQHGGYGIYIGDTYRAWAPERNRYFRLSAQNPDIKGNAMIALTVMEHHSDVDLSDKPVVVQVDYPIYADAARTEAAKSNIDAQLATFLAEADVKAKLESGSLRMVKTKTDTQTWEGDIAH